MLQKSSIVAQVSCLLQGGHDRMSLCSHIMLEMVLPFGILHEQERQLSGDITDSLPQGGCVCGGCRV